MWFEPLYSGWEGALRIDAAHIPGLQTPRLYSPKGKTSARRDEVPERCGCVAAEDTKRISCTASDRRIVKNCARFLSGEERCCTVSYDARRRLRLCF